MKIFNKLSAKRSFTACLLIFSALISGKAQGDSNTLKEYMPHIRGAVRARWENDFDLGKSRFQLRNARIMVDGKIASTIEYYLQADICDRGTMKFLDGWARIEAFKGFKIQAGQFRVPFGVDPFRAPGNYIFSNRSYIGKQICNVRAVGGKLIYVLPKAPVTLEAGIFNPTSIFDQTGWHSSYAYAGRVIYQPGNLRLDAGFLSLRPDYVRTNLIDAAIGWFSNSWDLAGEYMYKHYTNSAHKATHAYVVWGDYKMPVKWGVFNRLSFEGRFDGMTGHSNSVRNAEGLLTTTDPARNRITVGTTISYIRGRIGLDIRADYEKAFYHSGVEVPAGSGDKLVLEMVFRF